MPPGVPDEAPAFWNVSFAVEDTDATAALAVELGGSVILRAVRHARHRPRSPGVTDPCGASFSVAALAV